MKTAVQELPAQAGIDLSNWNWKAVRRLVQERFGLTLSRSSCLNYLHRLGFVLKRPQQRLVQADPVRREALVAEYAALAAARPTGAKLFFADEAHFQADAGLRGKWVLKGEPALLDSTSPRCGEQASYYSAVCLETGEVAVMELEGNIHLRLRDINAYVSRFLFHLYLLCERRPVLARCGLDWPRQLFGLCS